MSAAYEIIQTSGGNVEVKDPGILEQALGNVERGKFVVWSNDDARILYVEDTVDVADDAQSCGGDYSSVVVRKL